MKIDIKAGKRWH